MNHNSDKGRKAALDTQGFERIWELNPKISNPLLRTNDPPPGIQDEELDVSAEINSQSWSDVIFQGTTIHIILRW